MKLIVGLGNPGERYARTRHNIGFEVVDRLAGRHRIAFDSHEKDALTGRGRIAGQGVMLAKPLTFMNLSGRAVAGLVRAYLDDLSDLIVVYDDIDLPLGRIRVRESGSAGSHNGMKSILAELATERFARLRFGIGSQSVSPDRDLADFVLDRFKETEADIVEQGLGAAADALIFFVRGDIRGAMSRFNRDNATEETST